MKYPIRMIPIAMLIILFSACSPTITPVKEEVDVAGIHTLVAMTIEAQMAMITPSETAVPSTTPTLLPSPTVMQTMPTMKAMPISNVVSSVTSCDNSAYVSDVTIPDGTILAPSESFTKTWTIQNTGTCAWSTSYAISYVSGSAMSGSTTALSSAVSSGGTVSVSVAMVAPSSTGTYTGYWKIQNVAGTTFGETVYVQIVVSDDSSTLTPTATATESTSASSTATTASTAAPTSTPVPTSTTVPSSTPTTEMTAASS